MAMIVTMIGSQEDPTDEQWRQEVDFLGHRKPAQIGFDCLQLQLHQEQDTNNNNNVPVYLCTFVPMYHVTTSHYVPRCDRLTHSLSEVESSEYHYRRTNKNEGE